MGVSVLPYTVFTICPYFDVSNYVCFREIEKPSQFHENHYSLLYTSQWREFVKRPKLNN